MAEIGFWRFITIFFLGASAGLWIGAKLEASKWREKAHNQYGINRIYSKGAMYVVRLADGES